MVSVEGRIPGSAIRRPGTPRSLEPHDRSERVIVWLGSKPGSDKRWRGTLVSRAELEQTRVRRDALESALRRWAPECCFCDCDCVMLRDCGCWCGVHVCVYVCLMYAP